MSMNVEIRQVTERDRGIKIFDFEVHPDSSDANDVSPIKQLARLIGRWQDRRRQAASSTLEHPTH